MQRPIMHPNWQPLDDARQRRPPQGVLRRLIIAVWRSIAAIWKILTSSALPSRRDPDGSSRAGPRHLLSAFLRALLYRAMFLPVLLALAVAALVWSGTHPPQLASQLDPSSLGVYYDPVTFLSEDGVRLDGWLVPVVDEKRVLEQRE